MNASQTSFLDTIHKVGTDFAVGNSIVRKIRSKILFTANLVECKKN